MFAENNFIVWVVYYCVLLRIIFKSKFFYRRWENIFLLQISKNIYNRFAHMYKPVKRGPGEGGKFRFNLSDLTGRNICLALKIFANISKTEVRDWGDWCLSVCYLVTSYLPFRNRYFHITNFMCICMALTWIQQLDKNEKLYAIFYLWTLWWIFLEHEANVNCN